MTVKERIEEILSDIFSEKFDCKVKIKFVPKYEVEKEEKSA